MRSLIKFACLGVAMALLIAAMRAMMAAANQWESVALSLSMGQGLAGVMIARMAWKRLSCTAPVPPDADQTATAVLVARWTQQQTELRLAIGLAATLVLLMLALAMGIWPAQVIAIFVWPMLIVSSAAIAPRGARWAGAAALVLVIAALGLLITTVLQMMSMD